MRELQRSGAHARSNSSSAPGLRRRTVSRHCMYDLLDGRVPLLRRERARGRIARMPERTSYEPGTPSWVDLGTSDPDAAKEFYRSLFGWEAEDAGPVEETGGYGFFTLNGRKIAGVAGLMDPSQPVAWSTYVATEDL